MTFSSTVSGLQISEFKRRGLRAFFAPLAAVAALSAATPASADNLGWVGGTTEVNFVTPNAWMYAFSGGVGSTTDNPFTYNGGANFAYVGDSGAGSSSGKALLDSTTGDNNSLQSIRIGHNNSSMNFTSAGGPNLKGNGQLRVEGATPLTTKWAASPSGSGDFLVGGASGNNGTVDRKSVV